MTTRDGLYHIDIGIPWGRMHGFLNRSFGLEYGPHARQAALDDRYGQLTSVPLDLHVKSCEVFEVEVEQGEVVKFCVRLQDGFTVKTPNRHRMEISMLRDLILVCTPSRRDPKYLFVRTLWLNERRDSHRTLDPSKYTPYPL